MALYDGFFDAVFNEETGQYDRAYNSDDFTEYFGEIIGSGVCVHNNPDSFKVRFEDGAAVAAPGYLFIQGYWCKNDADYTVPLSGAGIYAIVAHLNTGARMIEITAQEKADSYPDALVLAYVTISYGGAAVVDDTRYDESICGVIDSAGSLSSKVEYALHYIDTEIGTKLAEAEAQIATQAALLDAKIVEVGEQVDKLAPPPVGTIKFSASQDIEDGWLRCDGSFISERDYPELVAALGKLTPSADKFSLISDGEIGTAISNVVMYGGRLWMYSYNARTLYGISTNGESTISIPVSSTYSYFNSLLAPTPNVPLILSIVPHINGTGAKLFLAQTVGTGRASGTTANTPAVGFEDKFLLFSSEFTGTETELPLEMPVQSITPYGTSTTYWPSFSTTQVPYVISANVNGVETYYCMCCALWSGTTGSSAFSQGGCICWTDGDTTAQVGYRTMLGTVDANSAQSYRSYQRFGFSPGNKGEAVSVFSRNYQTTQNPIQTYRGYVVYSALSELFAFESATTVPNSDHQRTSRLPLAIAGAKAIVYDIQPTGFAVAKLTTSELDYCEHGISLPSMARIFFDPGCYLDSKDIYMIFVGTGILFFRGFTAGDVGYLDTTSVLGTITQFGQLLYSQSDNALYLVGQDTDNKVKVAKMVLNTLFDYANDGAWLPMIASDGVPAYIKALETEVDTGPTVSMQVTITNSFSQYVSVLFNGEKLIPGTYTRMVLEGGKFSVGLRVDALTTGVNSRQYYLKLNGANAVSINGLGSVGSVETESFYTQDYISGGVSLTVSTTA